MRNLRWQRLGLFLWVICRISHTDKAWGEFEVGANPQKNGKIPQTNPALANSLLFEARNEILQVEGLQPTERVAFAPRQMRKVDMRAITGTSVGEEEVPWDINGDGKVNIFDLVLAGKDFGQVGEGLKTDVNKDGSVNIFDLELVGSHFGEKVWGRFVNIIITDLTEQEYIVDRTYHVLINDNLGVIVGNVEEVKVDADKGLGYFLVDRTAIPERVIILFDERTGETRAIGRFRLEDFTIDQIHQLAEAFVILLAPGAFTNDQVAYALSDVLELTPHMNELFENEMSTINSIIAPYLEVTSDVNLDGKINIFDLVIASGQLEDEGKSLIGDVTSDGKVNLFDLMAIASHFGKEVPGISEEKITFSFFENGEQKQFSVDRTVGLGRIFNQDEHVVGKVFGFIVDSKREDNLGYLFIQFSGESDTIIVLYDKESKETQAIGRFDPQTVPIRQIAEALVVLANPNTFSDDRVNEAIGQAFGDNDNQNGIFAIGQGYLIQDKKYFKTVDHMLLLLIPLFSSKSEAIRIRAISEFGLYMHSNISIEVKEQAVPQLIVDISGSDLIQIFSSAALMGVVKDRHLSEESSQQILNALKMKIKVERNEIVMWSLGGTLGVLASRLSPEEATQFIKEFRDSISKNPTAFFAYKIALTYMSLNEYSPRERELIGNAIGLDDQRMNIWKAWGIMIIEGAVQFTDQELISMTQLLDQYSWKWQGVITKENDETGEAGATFYPYGYSGVVTIWNTFNVYYDPITDDISEQTFGIVMVGHEMFHRLHYDLFVNDRKSYDYFTRLYIATGGDPDQFIREYSMFSVDEMVATTGEGWLADSEATLSLGITRAQKGKTILLNTILAVVDMINFKEGNEEYVLLSDYTRQNISGDELPKARITRDQFGFISSIEIDGLDWFVTRNESGDIIDISVTPHFPEPSVPQFGESVPLLTSNSSPEILGTGQPGTRVMIYIDGEEQENLFGTAKVKEDGRWRHTLPSQDIIASGFLASGISPLEIGEHTIFIKAIDIIGRESKVETRKITII